MDSSVAQWLCFVSEKEGGELTVACCAVFKEGKGKKEGEEKESGAKKASVCRKGHQNPVCKLQPKWTGETGVGICVDWQPIRAANLHKF